MRPAGEGEIKIKQFSVQRLNSGNNDYIRVDVYLRKEKSMTISICEHKKEMIKVLNE